jgi:hypothetical protein
MFLSPLFYALFLFGWIFIMCVDLVLTSSAARADDAEAITRGKKSLQTPGVPFRALDR